MGALEIRLTQILILELKTLQGWVWLLCSAGGGVRRGALTVGVGVGRRLWQGLEASLGDKVGPGSLGHGRPTGKNRPRGCLRGGGGTCCAQAFLGSTSSFLRLLFPIRSWSIRDEMGPRSSSVCRGPGLVQREAGLLFADGKRG